MTSPVGAAKNLISIALIALVGASTGLAQDPPSFKTVSNPYQEEFNYRVPQELAPRVDIDGMRWLTIRVEHREDAEPSESVPVTIEVAFENTIRDAAMVTVVILFEDSQGGGIGRVELRPFRISGNDTKPYRQRFKISGDVLRDTRKLYLFCEVQR